ncbi:PQ-loop repeat-containing protein [Bradyrhizobium sp. 200]|uniref:PQ-loop repeat-containing protein n=1 Tax=Bradyrhizobium sp. 200 TaxID=2782665 RepID=UPI001FFE9231|nr:PQ-loop repeat-containing protein [Bradyrhizobium sp. 200]UPJ47382.1 PQ-loop repeat-containing protein [Bradyrhizobium sp. 200]
MRLEDITLTLFAACNFIRLFAYFPQIYKTATDKNGASAISYTTWGLFLIANLSTVAYALVNRADWWLAACFTCNALCCLAILAVAYRRGHSHARTSGPTATPLPGSRRSLSEYMKQFIAVRTGSATQVVRDGSKEVEMPLPSLEELSPQDRVTYRRWVGGLFATYGSILMLCVAFVAYKVIVAPTQSQALAEPADENAIDTIGRSPVRQAVKHD